MSSTPAPSVARVRRVELPAEPSLGRWQGIDMYGGYGSDLAMLPTEPGMILLLTDRGPNFKTTRPGEKGFALPGFVPRLGRFRFDGEAVEFVGATELRDSEGTPLSGLPPPPGAASTGETAVGLAGDPLPFDPRGIDPEGLAAVPDGSFWIAEEYAPGLLHFASDGRLIERLAPGGVPRGLPAVLGTRRPNRGFEGLDLLPDGVTLVAILQSALDNPDAAVRGRAGVARILMMDTRTGRSRQYLYPKEAPGLSCSGVCALDGQTLLVIEHDARYPGDETRAAEVKRIYRVDLRMATDFGDAPDHAQGVRVVGRSLEQMAPNELAAAGVRTATKSLLVDLLALGYPHNKPEGIGVVDDHTLVVVNDDDFGIESDGRGGIIPKILPATGERDRNTLWFITLAAPLR